LACRVCSRAFSAFPAFIAIWPGASSTTLCELFQRAALGETLSWLRSSIPGIATRFEKAWRGYFALIKLASVRI